jgi:hypothetical protein
VPEMRARQKKFGLVKFKVIGPNEILVARIFLTIFWG